MQSWTNVEDVGPTLYKIYVIQIICAYWVNRCNKKAFTIHNRYEYNKQYLLFNTT